MIAMDVFGIAVIAICAVLLIAVVKKVNAEQGILIGLLAVVLILLFMLEKIAPLLEQLSGLMQTGLMDSGYVGILLKAVGVTIIGQITANLCKDSGESALSYAVEFAAKAAILILAMPIFTDIIQLLGKILTG